MKVEELRVGNIINPRSNAVVSAWELYQMSIRRNTGETETNEPIPLDKEWIEKFGFEFQEHESPLGMKLYVNNNWSFCLLEEFGIFSYAETQGEDYEYFEVKCVRTVHQLQNLYYALTGEELTINEI